MTVTLIKVLFRADSRAWKTCHPGILAREWRSKSRAIKRRLKTLQNNPRKTGGKKKTTQENTLPHIEVGKWVYLQE